MESDTKKSPEVSIIIPAYNEEKFIGKVIDTIPPYVDRIIVLDDGSTDNTYGVAKSHVDDRTLLIKHETNQGVGAAIVTGYNKALEENMDITAVMAGDAQMPPPELTRLLDPIVDNKADYVKGNRLLVRDATRKFPKFRFFGNAILTLITKISSGYWHIMDPQNGYTAVSKRVLETINWDKIYPGYGYCNDILVRLNVYNFRVMDVPTTPTYGKEKSGIRIGRYSSKLFLLLSSRFFWRLWRKYVLLSFHPLVFFYFFGIILLPLGFLIGLEILYYRLVLGTITGTTVVLCALLIITGLQFLLFAMFFDMESSKSLRGD